MIEAAPEWGLTKFHPLLDWSDTLVEAAITETGVPVNPLYASLGGAWFAFQPDLVRWGLQG